MTRVTGLSGYSLARVGYDPQRLKTKRAIRTIQFLFLFRESKPFLLFEFDKRIMHLSRRNLGIHIDSHAPRAEKSEGGFSAREKKKYPIAGQKSISLG